MKYVYIAGPYTGPTHDHRSYYAIDDHIRQAAAAAKMFAEAGVGYFCPHLHSAHFEVIAPEVSPQFWYELDIHFMEKCGAIVMLDGWEGSSGSKKEIALMREWERPVFFDVANAIEWARNAPQ